MLLYNITLGNLNLAPAPWSHIVDNYGTHFIAKDDIFQRIRIDNKIDQNSYPAEGELTPVWTASNMQCYEVLPGTRWINNNRNMNPFLTIDKNDDGREQIVIYLTVSNNYAITRFVTDHRILQTYHKKDTLQGCAIVLNTNDRDADNRIISINVYDRKKDQYCQFNISFMRDDLTKIQINRKSITNKSTLDVMKNQVKKFDGRYMGFKILTKPEELLTVTYVTSDRFKADVEKITKKINHAKIITVNPTDFENADSMQNVVAMLQNELESNRIKAITQCGVNLPLDVIRQLKLLYIFNYDIKNNILSCKKSN